MPLISSLRKNIFLICLFSELLGILILFSLVKKMVYFPGIHLTIILLFLIPFIIFFFQKNNDFKLLVLVVLPIFSFFYVYAISQNAPVGIQDPNDHLFRMMLFLNDNGKINFSLFDTLSSNYVSLYCLFAALNLITLEKYEFLAKLIPPFINIIILLFLAIIAYQLHSKKIAALAVFFYGWDITVIYLGQEFRTQTPGLLLFILIIYILINLIFLKVGKLDWRFYGLLILISIAIVPYSFVINFIMIFYLFTLIFIMIVFKLLIHYKEKISLILISTSFVYLLSLYYYLNYVGVSINSLFSQFGPLIEKAFFSTNTVNSQTTIIAKSFTDLFNPFIHYSIYFFYFFFAAFSILYFVFFLQQKKFLNLFLIFSFTPIAILFILTNIFGALSSGRVYIILLIMMAIATSFGICLIYTNKQTLKYQTVIKHLIIFICFLYVIINILQIPTYIIGNEEPFRSGGLIDTDPSWYYDTFQNSMTDFIIKNIQESNIMVFIDVPNYYFQENIYLKRTLSNRYEKSNILILRNSFNGRLILNHNAFPKKSDFNFYNEIYSNRDYSIFFN
jgi:hypothetical protein